MYGLHRAVLRDFRDDELILYWLSNASTLYHLVDQKLKRLQRIERKNREREFEKRREHDFSSSDSDSVDSDFDASESEGEMEHEDEDEEIFDMGNLDEFGGTHTSYLSFSCYKILYLLLY